MSTENEKMVDYQKMFDMKSDRLLVEVKLANEIKSAGGLILPVAAQGEDTAAEGKVLAVSKRILDNEYEADRILVGDTVVFSTYAGSVILFKGKTYKVLRMTDVMFVLNNE